MDSHQELHQDNGLALRFTLTFLSYPVIHFNPVVYTQTHIGTLGSHFRFTFLS